MGSKTEFDRDLEEYIKERNKKQIFNDIVQTIKSKRSSIQLNPEITPYEESENSGEVKMEESSKQRGFFSRLFGSREGEFVELQENNPSREELKTVAKIAIIHIKKLPPEEMEVFKASEEFKKLKDILKKYDLIK